MWINSMQREKNLGLTYPGASGGGTAWLVCSGAWLSSARVVRCWVKSRNRRNPRSHVASA